jgi:hypothetical protein
MTEKYSADWVKEQALSRNASWLDSHDCGGCGSMVGYSLDIDGVFFNPACDCTTFYSPPEPSSFQDIADWLAMQKTDETRDKIMEGLR